MPDRVNITEAERREVIEQFKRDVLGPSAGAALFSGLTKRQSVIILAEIMNAAIAEWLREEEGNGPAA